MPNLASFSPTWTSAPIAAAASAPMAIRRSRRRTSSPTPAMATNAPMPTVARVSSVARANPLAHSRAARDGSRHSRSVCAAAAMHSAAAHISVSWYTLTQPVRNRAGDTAIAVTTTVPGSAARAATERAA